MKIEEFYKNKKILITGHTGFKGAWMCELLSELGADVTGYALKPPTDPNLFDLCGLEKRIRSVEGDVRDLEHLKSVFESVEPEIVIHMAAQPIVRESYKNPVYTYDVNVMGTVNVLECVRLTDSVKSFVNVTTDKVYRNYEWERGYKEDDVLDGFDPYSNSKSCSELVTGSYRNSFFGGKNGCMKNGRAVAVSTCRAGNVLGGGDFATDRIIPDCIRAVEKDGEIVVRNPYSTRPYQHVLEPVTAYLIVAMKQYEDISKAGNYNIGPDDEDCINTGALVDLFCEKWNGLLSRNFEPEKNSIIRDGNTPQITISRAFRTDRPDDGPHEANFLKLDSTKIKEEMGIRNVWHVEEVMEKIVEWSYYYMKGANVHEITAKQIREYVKKSTLYSRCLERVD